MPKPRFVRGLLPTFSRKKVDKAALDDANTDPLRQYGMFYFTSEMPGPEQTIDLVAIHGLGGHYERTWTDKNTDQNWLRDFLPDQAPKLRIMSWGYNSKVLGSSSVANVTDFAKGLLTDLKICRATKELEKRPLIFVCHSLGGVVFKRVSL